jgi:hypothetical protein
MGGKGKGGSKALEKASKEILGTTRPVRNELSQQLLEVLQTGGSTARLPIIQQQVEGAKQAGAQAIQQTTGSLAAAGLDRTPFGQGILANTRQQAGQGENAARFNVVNQLLGGAQSFALGPLGPGISGLGTAAGLQQQQAQAQSQEVASGAAAAGAILAAIIAA